MQKIALTFEEVWVSMKDGKELKAENCSEAVEMSLISACVCL